jgi:hypothetical protein
MPAKRKTGVRAEPSKRHKITKDVPRSDSGKVRLPSPGFGGRKIDETAMTTASIRQRYVLSAAYVMKAMAPEGAPVDEESKEYKEALGLDFSCWWKTSQIILPSGTHFPSINKNTDHLDVEDMDGSAGLIRPVSEVQVVEIKKAFEEYGNKYNADYPVCCIQASSLLM